MSYDLICVKQIGKKSQPYVHCSCYDSILDSRTEKVLKDTYHLNTNGDLGQIKTTHINKGEIPEIL